MRAAPAQDHPVRAAAPPADYLRELDGLRAIAFLLVLWYHLPLSLQGERGGHLVAWLDTGYFGVDVFFALSGFVVTRVLVQDRARGASLRGFWLRRLLRICPIYYLTLLAVALVDPFAGLLPAAAYVANYAMLAGTDLRYLGHLWSLSVEEHFYLVWPLLLWLGGVRRGPWLVLLVLLPLSAATTWWYFQHERALLGPALTYATTSRLRALALGALFAFCERAIRARPGRATLLAGALAALATVSTHWFFDATGLAAAIVHSGFDAPERWLPVLQLVGYAAGSGAVVLLVIAWTGTAAPHSRLLRSPPLRWIGSISYGLYLYHLPILFLFGRAQLDADTGRARLLALAAIATTFAVAAVSFRFVERPLIAWGRRGRADLRSADGAR